MSAQILTVTLNPALDKLVPIKNFSAAMEYDPSTEIVSAGGKGLNVSRALQCLGTATSATGIIGGRAGKAIKRILKKEGIHNDFVVIGEESRTNITLKDRPTKNRLRLLSIGPKVNAGILKEFEKKYNRLLKSCTYVCLSGKNAHGAPSGYYGKLVRLARKKKVVTVLDTSGIEFNAGLKAGPAIIKPNLEEAQEVLGMKLSSLKKIKEALIRFRKMGIKMVLLTLAQRGAVGCTGEEFWYCRVPKVKIKHEVGCGDAFLAGFLHQYQREKDFKDALVFATACGTVNCQGVIPGFIHRREVSALTGKIKVRKL